MNKRKADLRTLRQPCSCGCLEPHVIMHRATADDVKLALWSDGAITHGRGGTYLRGLGTPRSAYRKRHRAQAVRLLADDFARFDVAELPALVKLAERTFSYTYSSELDRRAHVLAIAFRKMRAQNKNCLTRPQTFLPSTHPMTAEKTLEPDWHLLKLDERRFWIDEVQAQTTDLFGVYAFNRNEETHCCELTPSYCLHYIGTDYGCVDAVADNEDARNALDETISAAEHELTTFMHVRAVEQVIATRPERVRRLDLTTPEWLEERSTEREQVDYIAEAWGTGAEMY